jgi:cell shape-determining protein MreD
MTVFFYIFVSLCLVMIKTTLIPGLQVFEKFYDLLIPIIIYLSLFRSLKEGVPVVLFFGLIMDSLCGGPLGLYLASYVWLYAGMWWLRQFLHTGSFVLLAICVSMGVVFEGAVMLAYMVVLAPTVILPEDALQTLSAQAFWSLFTGPVILFLIHRVQKQVDVVRDHIFPDFFEMKGK